VALTDGDAGQDGASWSPDGAWIAFRSDMSGRARRIHLIPSVGGTPIPITAADEEQGVPSWSPKGTQLAFGDVPGQFGKPRGEEQLWTYDLATKRVSMLPGSRDQRVWSPRWSPDDRYLAAVTLKGQSLKLYDRESGTWHRLNVEHVKNAMWSSDSKFIYYDTEGGTHKLARVRISDRMVEELFDLATIPQPSDSWIGLSPEDWPITLRSLGTTSIYAFRLSSK
jgi:Tol biopolymer transport system component